MRGQLWGACEGLTNVVRASSRFFEVFFYWGNNTQDFRILSRFSCSFNPVFPLIKLLSRFVGTLTGLAISAKRVCTTQFQLAIT